MRQERTRYYTSREPIRIWVRAEEKERGTETLHFNNWASFELGALIPTARARIGLRGFVLLARRTLDGAGIFFFLVKRRLTD